MARNKQANLLCESANHFLVLKCERSAYFGTAFERGREALDALVEIADLLLVATGHLSDL